MNKISKYMFMCGLVLTVVSMLSFLWTAVFMLAHITTFAGPSVVPLIGMVTGVTLMAIALVVSMVVDIFINE